jgi:D-alanyl-D-alanine carboxypeptidase
LAGSRSRAQAWRDQGRRIFGIFFCLSAALILGLPRAFASDKHAALLMDLNSGHILYHSAADQPRHPASLAKLMTLYLVFERLEQGKLDDRTKLKISTNASAAAPSKLDLEPGEEIAVSDAVKALITKSANDVAVALAEHIAGSEERFARVMTDKARQFGMAATTFRNASGLPDPEQVTTARDMATLALRLMDDFPKRYALFATRTFTYKTETFRNHNSLLFHYQGTDGLKTGYTRASGFNLVASVRRGRKHVLGVVFGGSTAAARNTTMRALLNIGLHKGASAQTRRRAVVAAVPPAPPNATRGPPTAARRAAPQAPAAEPASPTVAAAGPAPRFEMAQVRPVLLSRSEPPDHDARAEEPATIEALLARSARAGPTEAGERLAPGPEGAPGAAAEAPTLLGPPRLVRGSAPSTLDAQALTLRRETGSAAAVTAGGLAIQVGAFQSAEEALRRLAWVRQRANGLVARHEAVTQPVKQGDKLFYRARFAGFDGAAAAAACRELRALKVECLILRGD